MDNNRKALRAGSALLLVLVTIVLLSTMVVSLVYRMKLEGELAARYRFRMKAHAHAQAGLEWAKLLMLKSQRPGDEEDEYGEEFRVQSINLNRGMALNQITHEMAEGKFTLTISPEQGRRNINQLNRLDWEEIFEQTGIPDDYWDDLIGAFDDWVDDNDAEKLNGAESDHEFYRDRDYEVKNAPIDTIDELLLIKGFEKAIVYGGRLGDPDDDDAVNVTGIAPLLTVYGDGKVNVNTASAQVLMSIPELNEDMVERLLEGRLGIDELAGTEDDGFRTPVEALAYAGAPGTLQQKITTTERRYIRVTSIGEAGETKTGIWCIFEQSGQNFTPVFFREEEMP